LTFLKHLLILSALGQIIWPKISIFPRLSSVFRINLTIKVKKLSNYRPDCQLSKFYKNFHNYISAKFYLSFLKLSWLRLIINKTSYGHFQNCCKLELKTCLNCSLKIWLTTIDFISFFWKENHIIKKEWTTNKMKSISNLFSMEYVFVVEINKATSN
jgi:hypothetical protein